MRPIHPIGFILRIEPGAPHPFNGIIAEARLIPAHVEEDAIDRLEELEDFRRLVGKKILVRAAHIHDLPARCQRPRANRPAIGLRAIHCGYSSAAYSSHCTEM